MSRLKLMLITNDVEIATHAVDCGVDRLFVDMETRGKEERQGHLDTHRAEHTPDDVRRLRAALPGAEILTRVNPLYHGSGDEVDALVAAGADYLMLPMFRTAEEVSEFLDLVAGRAGVTLLLETPQALVRIDEILEHRARIDEIHVGLNDLHLGMGLDFMFELLAGGLIDYLAHKIRAAGVRFGFGGIARIGEGMVPAELVLGEHVRLGSELVILSRAFHNQARSLAELRVSIDLAEEIRKLRAREAEFRAAGPELLEENRARLRESVRAFARQRRARVAAGG